MVPGSSWRLPCRGQGGWRYARLVLLLFPLMACNGQLGCMSCGNGFVYPEPPPEAGTLEPNTLIGQVQQSGLTFVTSHFADILRAQLPTRTAGGIERAIFYLPEATVGSGTSVTIRDGCIGPNPVAPATCPARSDPSDASRGPTYRSKVELNLDTIDQSIVATFVPGAGATPNGIHIDLSNVDLFIDAALVIQAPVLGNATCLIQDHQVDQAAIHLDHLAFTIDLTVDASNAFLGQVTDVTVDIGSFGSSDLLNFDITPCNGGVCADPYCDGFWSDFTCSTLCYASDFVFTVANLVSDVLAPLVNYIAPSIVEAAASSLLAQVNGQPLSLSGQFGFDQLFGALSAAPLLMDPTQFAFGAHPNANAFVVSGPVTSRGMRLNLDAGSFADPSQCAPTVSLPSFASQLGDAPFFDGTLQVGDHTEAYDVAVGISEAFVAQAAFSAYELGAECLALSADDLASLSNGVVSLGALTLLVPGLAGWGDPASPLMFRVHPTAAPKIHFGTGAVTGHDAQGNPIVDSLVQLDLGEIGISIYAVLDGEPQRLATIAADVSLGMALVRTPRNTIEVGLDHLGVQNLVEVYDEMLPGSDYGALMQVLLNVTLGSLIGSVGSFDLDLAPIVSSMLGNAPVYARINGVERVGTGTDNGFIAAYVTFCTEADLTNPAKPPCYTPPTGASLSLARAVHVERGLVVLEVDPSREYQVQVDGGAWTGMRRPEAGALRVAHPLLGLPGAHTLLVRSRVAGRYFTRDESPIRLELTVD